LAQTLSYKRLVLLTFRQHLGFAGAGRGRFLLTSGFRFPLTTGFFGQGLKLLLSQSALGFLALTLRLLAGSLFLTFTLRFFLPATLFLATLLFLGFALCLFLAPAFLFSTLALTLLGLRLGSLPGSLLFPCLLLGPLTGLSFLALALFFPLPRLFLSLPFGFPPGLLFLLTTAFCLLLLMLTLLLLAALLFTIPLILLIHHRAWPGFRADQPCRNGSGLRLRYRRCPGPARQRNPDNQQV
jgi:hypothetical protein